MSRAALARIPKRLKEAAKAPAPSPYNIQADIIFLGFSKYDEATGQTETLSEPPHVPMKRNRDGNEYTGDLEVIGRVMNLTTVKDQCEPLADGSGWNVKAEVGFSFADKKCPFGAEAWVLRPMDPKTCPFPVADYVQTKTIAVPVVADAASSAAGAGAITATPLTVMETIKEKWIVVRRGQTYKFKFKNDDDNVFLQRNLDGITYKVRPRTRIIFNSAKLQLWVRLNRKEDSEKKKKKNAAAAPPAPGGAAAPPPAPGGAAAPAAELVAAPPLGADAAAAPASTGGLDDWIPVVSTSFKAHFPTVSSDHDMTLPESELIHAQEDCNRHVLVPISQLRLGDPDRTVHIWLDNYWTPSPARFGVGISRDTSATRESFFMVSQKDGKFQSYKTVIRVVQWHGSDEDPNYQLYQVKLETSYKSQLWRAWRIHDPWYYESLMEANQDIPAHIDGTVWVGSMLSNPANTPESLEVARREDGMKQYEGEYFVWIRSLVPDFLGYFLSNGIWISEHAVMREFGRSMNYDGQGQIKSIDLKPANPNAPPITQNLGDAVIALGNGQVDDRTKAKPISLNHAMDIDVLPLLKECYFFAITSYKLTGEERSRYCGLQTATASADERDAFFSSVLAQRPLPAYWIYAAKRSALTAAAQGAAARKATATAVAVAVAPAEPAVGDGGIKRDAEADDDGSSSLQEPAQKIQAQ